MHHVLRVRERRLLEWLRIGHRDVRAGHALHRCIEPVEGLLLNQRREVRAHAALVQEQGFDWLDAPIGRVTGADLPMPYSKPLEQISFPNEDRIIEAVVATFRDI